MRILDGCYSDSNVIVNLTLIVLLDALSKIGEQ